MENIFHFFVLFLFNYICVCLYFVLVDDISVSSLLGETKRLRLDMGRDIFTRLTTVFDTTGPRLFDNVWMVPTDSDNMFDASENSATVVHSIIIERNMQSLLLLNGANILLDHCFHLPYLQRFVTLNWKIKMLHDNFNAYFGEI